MRNLIQPTKVIVGTDGRDLEQEVRRRALEIRSDIDEDMLEALAAMVAEAESLEAFKVLLADMQMGETDLLALWDLKGEDQGAKKPSTAGQAKTFCTRKQKDAEQVERYLIQKREREEEEEVARRKKFRELDSYFKNHELRTNDMAVVALMEEKEVHPEPEITAETKTALRALGWPITLFGETDAARVDRLMKMRLMVDEDRNAGQVNVFQHEMKKEAKGERHVDSSDDEGEKPTVENDVSTWIKKMFVLWAKRIDGFSDVDEGRGPSEQQKEKGRFRQAKEYMKPLRKRLRSCELPADILESLSIIAELVRNREYGCANAEYMKLAIGNAAWPLGVTKTSVHTRPADEKIKDCTQASNVNDETVRKYLQMVKRLITVAEECDKQGVT